MNYAKLFFMRILKDLRQKDLLPLKLLFFLHSSTILVLYPYLTIHMRELGINVEETAIMSAVTPAVAILMPPVAGIIADKLGNFRAMLSCFSMVGGACSLLLLLVPVGRMTLTHPQEVIFALACPAEEPIMLTLHQPLPCDPVAGSNETINADLTMQSCGYVCRAILNDDYTKAVVTTRKYEVRMWDVENNSSLTYTYKLSEDDVIEGQLMLSTTMKRVLENNERYHTSVRVLSRSLIFFPASSLFKFSCDLGLEDEVFCMMGFGDRLEDFARINRRFNVDLSIDDEDFDDKRRTYTVEKIENKTNVRCVENRTLKKKHITITIPLTNVNSTNATHLDLGSCSRQCLVSSPRTQICSNPKSVIEFDMQKTFWMYLGFRVLVGVISGTSFAMFEGAVIAILREHKADYGLQRIYATLGGMISSPLSGMLIDVVSVGKEYTDFRPVFYVYASLKFISAVFMLFINLKFKKAANTVVADVLHVMKKLELITLFVACLMLGCAWGFLESFLFWFVEDLGGSKTIMGLTITIAGLVGIPLLVLSGPIIKKVGHANVIFIGFIFYAIRLLGYSWIYNPWFALFFEAMESITFGLSFTAAVTYAAKLSTATTDTSVQGTLGGIYYGAGKGVGSLVGGYLMKPFGDRATFRIFALGSAITGAIYFAFYHFYLKYRPSEGRDITKKDPIPPPNHATFTVAESHELPAAVYEDAMCNLAYEDTEGDLKNEEDGKNNVTNAQAAA